MTPFTFEDWAVTKEPLTDALSQTRTRLNRQQIIGFWGAWLGWTLDGMDSVIYALVLAPALTELLPRSGMEATPARIGYTGSVMFALFLIGWGCAFLWGPIADHAERLGTRRIPASRRHRRGRRVGDGRDVRRRGVARGPSHEGRRIPAN